MTAVESLPLAGSPRPLRRVREDESPYPGILCAGEPATVCVRDADLPEVVWRADPGGHLLAPVEAVRIPAGTAALVPVCRGPLRGSDAGTAGRAVTVAVSMIRAAREATELGEETGSWWIDGDGRPVLALGVGGSWRSAAAAILADIAVTSPGALARMLAMIGDGIGQPAIVRRDADGWEDSLFGAAEPQAVAASPEDVAADAADTAIPRRAATVGREAPASTQVVESLFARLVDGDLAHRAAHAVAATRAGLDEAVRRFRPGRVFAMRTEDADAPAARSLRRGPLLAGVAVVGLVLTFGLLWPDDGSASRPGPAMSSNSPAAAESSPVSTPPTPEEPDALEHAARRALDGLAQCLAGDEAACNASREDPTAPLPGGLIASGEPVTSLEVLDEYGGVAVIRVDADGLPSQAVVLVQAGESWLVRDVYDLADQP